MESLMRISESVKKFLDRYYDVSYEDFSSWTDHMHPGSMFRSQASPIAFNAWGNIGEYLRYLFFHPVQKTGFFSKMELDSPFQYKEPIFGLEVVNRISGLTLFNDGIFKASSLYKFAMQLREYLSVADMYFRSKIENKKYRLLSPRLFYAALDILGSSREIQYRVNTSIADFEEFGGLKIGFYDIPEDPVPNILEYHKWFVTSFLNENHFHQMLFEVFFNCCTIYMKDWGTMVEQEIKDGLEETIITLTRSYLGTLLSDEVLNKTTNYGKGLLNLISEGYFENKMPKITSKKSLDSSIKKIPRDRILSAFEDIFMTILDMTVPEVFHELTAPPALSMVDWEGLKLHLIKRFHEGNRYGAIFITPSGDTGIGVLPKEHQYLAPIEDPEKEVFLSMNESGIGIIRKVKWEDVISGKCFQLSASSS